MKKFLNSFQIWFCVFFAVLLLQGAAIAQAPPTVSLTAPANGASFVPGNINLSATASDSDGNITKVEFYLGGTFLLATVTSPPYNYTWVNAAAGSYSVTAKAYDDGGFTTTTAANNITIAANVPPTVSLIAPANGASFVPGNISLSANASDSDGNITKVEFYLGGTFLLGTVTSAPYNYTWINAAAGVYSVTAKAYDDGGLSTTTAVNNITIATPNVAPTVSLTAPANGANFVPGNINLSATASDSDGSITKVEFYLGGTFLLGTVTGAPYNYTWVNAAAGVYSVTAKAYDNGGLTTTTAAANITIVAPNVAPTVTLTTPATGDSYLPGSINLSATASDSDGNITKVEFYLGGTFLLATVTSAPYNYTWVNAAVGSYSVTAKAYDNGGLTTTTAAANITVVAPNVAPTVTLTAPATGDSYLPGNINLSATASDSDGNISKVEFYLGGTFLLGTVTSAPYNYTWVNAAVGSYSVTAKAYDNGGLTTTTAAANITVVAPNVAPTVTLTAPANGASFAPGNINLSATASDSDGNITKVEFYLGGTFLLGTATSAPYNYTWINAAAGSYSVTAKAYDNGGLTTTTAANNITIAAANVAPTVSLIAPANGASFVPGNINLSATAADSDGNITKVEFYLGGIFLLGTVTSAPYNYTWINAAAGSYSVTAKAYDNGGLTTTTAAANITIAAPPPNVAPTVTLTAPANGASFVPGNINLSATAADSDGNITKVEFYLGGTFLLGTVTSAPYNYTWINAAVGNYSVTAKAYDNGGLSTTTTAASITIAANVPPTVSLSAPANGASFAAGNINLSATAADSDGNITKVEFYLGGTFLLGTVTSAPYNYTWVNAAAGTYSVTAKAYDNGGLSTTTAAANITITNVAPTVTLTAPANGATFIPGNINLSATASDSDGNITKVEFYLGGTFLLATVTSAPYNYTWSNAAAGSYSVTAKAYDNGGLTTTTAANNITITATPVCTIVAGARATAGTVVLTSTCNPTATARRWKKDGVLISGATGATYTAPMLTVAAVYSMAGQNANGWGVDSPGVTVAAFTAPACTITGGVRSTTTGTVVLTSSCAPTPTALRWTQNSVIISAATAATYTAPVSASAIDYAVAGQNVLGWGANSAIFTVPALPQPTCSIAAATRATNGTVTLTATCSPLVTAYKWTRDNVVISGATAVTYVAPASGAASDYKVAAQNISGFGVDSAVTTVAALTLPTCTVAAGARVAAGTVPLTATCSPNVTAYRWARDGVLIAGATSTTYSAPMSATASNYTAAAQNLSGWGANSSNANVPALPLPTCTIAQALPAVNGTVVLTATCEPNVTVRRWSKNGVIISGATGTTYTAPAPTIATNYVVAGQNISGWSPDSAVAIVAPPSAPSCTIAAGTRAVNGTVVLTASCTPAATNATSYRWTLAPATTPIVGATSTTYTVPASVTDATYKVAGQNAVGWSVTDATFTVPGIPAPVCSIARGTTNGNGTVPLTASCAPVATALTWKRNGTVIAGATAALYTATPPISGTDSYTVVGQNYVFNGADSIPPVAVVPINVAPTVNVTSPTANASFGPGAIGLSATATDSDGIAKVEFYLGGTFKLATVTAAPYNYTWLDAAVGTYVITAKAYDNSGLINTSSAVSITVTDLLSKTVAGLGSGFDVLLNTTQFAGAASRIEFFERAVSTSYPTSPNKVVNLPQDQPLYQWTDTKIGSPVVHYVGAVVYNSANQILWSGEISVLSIIAGVPSVLVVQKDSIATDRSFSGFFGLPAYDLQPTAMKEVDGTLKVWWAGNHYKVAKIPTTNCANINNCPIALLSGDFVIPAYNSSDLYRYETIGGDAIKYATSNDTSTSWVHQNQSCPLANGGVCATSGDVTVQPVLEPDNARPVLVGGVVKLDKSSFDSIHTADPSVIRVNGTYYMYYTGGRNPYYNLETHELITGTAAQMGCPIVVGGQIVGYNRDDYSRIGVAESSDGINWTTANPRRPFLTNNRSRPITCSIATLSYGAGQPSVTYVPGIPASGTKAAVPARFYLFYTETTNDGGGSGVYVIRSENAKFTGVVEEYVKNGNQSGWVSLTRRKWCAKSMVLGMEGAEAIWTDNSEAVNTTCANGSGNDTVLNTQNTHRLLTPTEVLNPGNGPAANTSIDWQYVDIPGHEGFISAVTNGSVATSFTYFRFIEDQFIATKVYQNASGYEPQGFYHYDGPSIVSTPQKTAIPYEVNGVFKGMTIDHLVSSSAAPNDYNYDRTDIRLKKMFITLFP